MNRNFPLSGILGILSHAWLVLIVSSLTCHSANADWRSNCEIIPQKIAHLSQSEQKLLLEYPAHSKALRHFYNNLTIEGDRVTEIRGENGVWSHEGKVSGIFKTRGLDHFKVDYIDGAGRHLGVMNPSEWYIFQENRSTRRLFIESHGKSSQSVVDNYLGTYLYNLRPTWLGYLDGAITDPLNDDSKIYRVTEAISPEGDRIVRVIVHSVFVKPHISLCVVDLMRDRSWATSELVYASPDSKERNYTVLRFSCRYEDTVSGIPVLTETIEYPSFLVPFGEGPEDPMLFYQPKLPEDPPKRERVIISKLIPEPPSIEEFDPTPIIAQIGGIGQTQTNSFRGFLLWINAVFLLFLGAYLLKKKKKKPDSPPSSEGNTLA